jgi:hypothetical protein
MKTQIENLSAILSPNSGKEEVSSLVNQIVSNIEEGTTNALEVFIHLHKLAKVAEDVRSQIMDAALTEAAKYGKGEKMFGVEFTTAEAGTRYDFSECGDPIHAEILELEANVKAQKAEREKFLKSLPAGKNPIVIPATGELVEIVSPIKKSSTVLKITLK